MRFRINEPVRCVLCSVVFSLLLVQLHFLGPVAAASGSLQITIQGYGTFSGQLQNAAVMPNNTVSMIMVLNDQVQTQYGPAQLSGTGTFGGMRNGAVVSGQIHDATGKIQLCILVCFAAHYVGQGNWNGSLNGSRGAGVLQGSITFTDSPVSQIPVGRSISLAGTWTSDFDMPVPEFRLQFPTIVLVFAIATCAISTVSRLKRVVNSL